MKNEQLLNKTLDILTEAYQNGILRSSMCAACAVGNIVAACTGNTIYQMLDGNIAWQGNIGGQARWWREVDYYRQTGRYKDLLEARHLVNSTGYSIEELSQIEYAFERGAKNGGEYAGLQAVYETLLNIHEVVNISEVQECIFSTTTVESLLASMEVAEPAELVLV